MTWYATRPSDARTMTSGRSATHPACTSPGIATLVGVRARVRVRARGGVRVRLRVGAGGVVLPPAPRVGSTLESAKVQVKPILIVGS